MTPNGSEEVRPAVTRVSFVAGDGGDWRVERLTAVRGETLPATPGLSRVEGGELGGAAGGAAGGAGWVLRGVRSHERYLERAERQRLAAIQEGLGRPGSRLGALIPIRKSEAWWELPQDDRRAIFEARSQHLTIGSRFLPAIARRLYHARDLGEPFDFLTWFEFGEADAGAFDELVGRLRETEEWRYVVREVDLRLRRA